MQLRYPRSDLQGTETRNDQSCFHYLCPSKQQGPPVNETPNPHGATIYIIIYKERVFYSLYEILQKMPKLNATNKAGHNCTPKVTGKR